ncbi:MAG: GNAT family N-acetyltransferase [Paracoccaceae bacterium]|nr:GNAT family N-acetyltransferase [Paracoccaceae bacterium]
MSTLITIRRAARADLARVETLLLRSFPRLLKGAYPPSTMVLAVPKLLRADRAQIESGRHWVAVDDRDRLIAAGGWVETRRSWADARGGAVRQFVTDPAFVRRGLGAAIMAQVIKTARDAGMGTLSCQATLNAVPFYAALGFESRGRRCISLGPAVEFEFEAMVRKL